MARRPVATVVALLLALSASAGEPPALEKEFGDRCRSLLGERVQGTREDVLGQEGWVLLTSELRFASIGRFFGPDAIKASPRVKPEVADPIPAIVDFAEQLGARGVALIFMPVPVRPLVYPESVLGAERLRGITPVPYLFSDQVAFIAALRERGVRAIDLTPIFLAHRDDPHAPIFVPSESHWTGLGTVLAAREVAASVRGEPWLERAARIELAADWQVLEHSGHIYRDIHEKGGLPPRPPDRLHYRRVQLATSTGLQPLSLQNPDSPVVVMGDSNTIWWRDRGASFPHQLAHELRIPVDVQATTGGGATNARLNLIRTARANPGYLASKKLVVWCFSSRATIEGSDGWPMTPIDPPPTPVQSAPAEAAAK
jgi:alginate O-acetyltransferase complex protein AlgJ